MARPKGSGSAAKATTATIAAVTAKRHSTSARFDGLAPQTLVLDNGAHTIKAGLVAHATPATNPSCNVIPNCIARSQRDKLTYIGNELYSCADYGELAFRRPVEKGFVVNWEGEKTIWEKSFFETGASGVAEQDLRCDPHETNLLWTEAPNSPAALQRNADEMVFEEFEFASGYRVADNADGWNGLIAPLLNAYAPSPFASSVELAAGTPMECVLVVDAGHSYTTVTPLFNGRPIHSACRRLEVGGKTLTNQLKELISRTFDIHREDWIATEMKEEVCYVSQSFNADLERVWKGGRKDPRTIDTSVVVDYVLPDYETIKRGFARPHDPAVNFRKRALDLGPGPKEHIVTIGNERFVVPELLFTPSDIGMDQEGICGTVLQSIHALPEGLWQVFLANILVVGGTSKLSGFVERLEADLRSMVDESLLVRIARADDPLKNAWIGGVRIAQNEQLMKDLVVTKAEYLENGALWTRRKFAGKLAR
nr:actin-like protein arp6 [Quercus suber]